MVVVFQGNAGHLGDRVPKLKPLIDAGFGVLFAGYRGYSGNPGKPTEDDLTADALGLLDWLAEQGVGLERTVVYGESLGSGVAVKMALERRVAAMVLESPYTSIAELSQVHYWYLARSALIRPKRSSAWTTRFCRSSIPLMLVPPVSLIAGNLGQEMVGNSLTTLKNNEVKSADLREPAYG